MQEFHADRLTVDITVKIKNIHLNIARHTVDGWPVSNIAHTQMLGIMQVDLHGKNAIFRYQFIGFFNQDIGGRVAYSATDLIAAVYFAGDKKGVT